MSHSANQKRAGRKILLVRMNHSYAGFFSYVTFVLNQLRYCESTGLLPVVYFGPRSGDGPNAFYDRRHGENTWDYYFEPLAGLTWLDVCSRLANPCDPLAAADVVQLDSAFLWYLHAYDPDGIYNYPYGHYRSLPDECLAGWYRPAAGRRAPAAGPLRPPQAAHHREGGPVLGRSPGRSRRHRRAHARQRQGRGRRASGAFRGSSSPTSTSPTSIASWTRRPTAALSRHRTVAVRRPDAPPLRRDARDARRAPDRPVRSDEQPVSGSVRQDIARAKKCWWTACCCRELAGSCGAPPRSVSTRSISTSGWRR